MNHTYRSAEINLIMGALAKAQGSYKRVIPNRMGVQGKWADIEAILLAARESLSTNGLSFYRYVELLDEGSGAALLWSMLGHESGQYISSCARVVSGKTDRQTGNTYEFHARQHAYLLLGIAPGQYDPELYDDNGEGQAEQSLIQELRKPVDMQQHDRQDTISKEQYNNLLDELDGYDKVAADIMELYKISTLADLPRTEYQQTLAKIRRIRRTTEEYAIKGR